MSQSREAFDIKKYIPLAVCIVFYMTFCFVFGVQICADSDGYIQMIPEREPIYPLFLALLRKIFGEGGYFNIVIIIQNLLMAISVYLLCDFVTEELGLKRWCEYALISMHFAVALLCQFAAGRGSIYPNSILTEGLALPLWTLFAYFLWKGILHDNMKSIVTAAVLCGVMMDVRKQMAVGFIALCGCVFMCFLGKNGFFRRLVVTVGVCMLSVILAFGGTRIYNLFLRGSFAQNTRDMNLVLTTSLYVADPEDAELIEEESVRELFVETMEILDERQCIYKYAPDGWRGLEEHYADSYDKITVDTTGQLFRDYAASQGFTESMDIDKEADRMSSVIVSSLLKDNGAKYIKIYMASMANGFVNTVAKRNKVLDGYAFVVYVIYVVLMAICLMNPRNRRAGVVGFMALMGVVANVGVTAALIFCQTRYMMYNMALFYMGLIVMLYTLMDLGNIKKRRR